MTARTASYSIDATNPYVGHRAHLPACYHLTEGQPLPANGKGVQAKWRSFWNLPSNNIRFRPICVQKVGGPGGTDISGILKNLEEANRLGFSTCLQIRDDEPGMRSFAQAKAIIDQYWPPIMAGPARPDIVLYGNEPRLNNTSIDSDFFAQRVSDIYEYLAEIDTQVLFALVATADWLGYYEWCSKLLNKIGPKARRRTKIAVSHHYEARPSLAHQLNYAGFTKEWFPDGVCLMGEGGRTAWNFGQGALDSEIDSIRGGIFNAAHALENMMANIGTCHYTLQNNVTVAGEKGNGMFSREEIEKPTVQAYRDFVAWITKSEMLNLTRDSWDSTGVFLAKNGKLVAYNWTPQDNADALTSYSRWLRMSSYAEDNSHVSVGDVLSWAMGTGPQPSYAPLWEPDWTDAQDEYDTLTADRAASEKTITVDVSGRGWTYFKFVSDDNVGEYMSHSGAPPSSSYNSSTGILTLTLPRWSMLRGQFG